MQETIILFEHLLDKVNRDLTVLGNFIIELNKHYLCEADRNSMVAPSFSNPSHAESLAPESAGKPL